MILSLQSIRKYVYFLTNIFVFQVSIELSEREMLPGDHVTVHVNTRPDSCVCIGGVDKSVHLIRPGYQLSQEEVRLQ